MNSLEKDAGQYLKDRNEYNKIMKSLLEKYKKTGKLTGKVKISKISEEESLVLGAVDYTLYGEKEVMLSVKKFISYFCSGKYEKTDFLEVMKFYFGEDALITKREINDEKNLLKEKFFIDIENSFKAVETKIWFESMLSIKKFGYTTVLKLYKENEKELKEILLNIDKGFSHIDSINEEYIPLAKFSSLITKDSHYFDIDNVSGKLFIHALGYLNDIRVESIEGRNEALMKARIVRDEVSNFTITYGLLVYDDNKEVVGYEWFRREKQPLLLNIYNLNDIKEIKGVHNKVYVFENPTVFYELLKKCKDIPVSLICTSGQLNASSIILLEKLRKSNTIIYYSGDFDPEGLQIASNIKYRYGDSVKFLGMNIENYNKIKGNISFAHRVGKLDSISLKELKSLADEMKISCMAGYQELLSDYYFDFIRNNV